VVDGERATMGRREGFAGEIAAVRSKQGVRVNNDIARGLEIHVSDLAKG
jgi:hypothetical protein